MKKNNNLLEVHDEVIKTSKFELTKEDTRENIFYVLAMIPYPSGAGMHLGHVMNYSAIDAIGRFKKYN
jgi:leucyl-tRNA synthetase